jgi:hypothetical protein
MSRQIMYVHSFFIAFIVFLTGLMCVTLASELTTTNLGRSISGGMAAFWLARLYVQFFVYPREAWKGKRMETLLHILAIAFWTYLTAIFAFSSLG